MFTPTTVRMFNEYGCNWPFWGEDGLLEQDHFPLPPDLTQDVLAWTRNFNQHFDHEKGWPTAEQRETSRREGERLAERVQDAVDPGITIELDLWEARMNESRPPWGRRAFRSRSERA
ncbi:hypothetical protein [Kocuria rhizophila]|uniref:hypothetical protein n=1 Tax=Kocuria rhizophila TaxID=72000 RepID=UPI001CA9F7E7|nr:hypothetical protein [Kocuria rhizophila]MDA4827769.1 hypothetical protein [Kocuria rhizophila]WSQ04136.1 hypothetical protein OG312_06880 [Kocuria rhizophila]